MKKQYELSRKPKEAWPTKAAMQQVYAQKLWGDYNTDFYSGDGSHKAEYVLPYVKTVKSFLKTFKKPLAVCDLGCGDFNIGKALVPYSKNYSAIDIVPNLIERNKELFKAKNLEFKCLDIAVDDLPSGDCAILRQVLQHLSNAEILQILPKLAAFTYVILTEHIPDGDFEPNKDIISGQGIRLKKQSGVNLLAPPFQLKAKSVEEVLAIPLPNAKGVLVTRIYKMK